MEIQFLNETPLLKEENVARKTSTLDEPIIDIMQLEEYELKHSSTPSKMHSFIVLKKEPFQEAVMLQPNLNSFIESSSSFSNPSYQQVNNVTSHLSSSDNSNSSDGNNKTHPHSKDNLSYHPTDINVELDVEMNMDLDMDKELDSKNDELLQLQPKVVCLDGATTDPQAPFACHWDQCQWFFRVLGDLTKHLDSHYTYYKGMKCLWRGCWRQGRSFEGGRHMVFHMNSHTGARPYQCPLCEKRFSTVPNYRTHSKNVHDSSNLKYIYIDYDTACIPYQQSTTVINNNTGKKYKTAGKPSSNSSNSKSSSSSSSFQLRSSLSSSPQPRPTRLNPTKTPLKPLDIPTPPTLRSSTSSSSSPSSSSLVHPLSPSLSPLSPTHDHVMTSTFPSSLSLLPSKLVPSSIPTFKKTKTRSTASSSSSFLKRNATSSSMVTSMSTALSPLTTLPEIKSRLLTLYDQLQQLLFTTSLPPTTTCTTTTSTKKGTSNANPHFTPGSPSSSSSSSYLSFSPTLLSSLQHLLHQCEMTLNKLNMSTHTTSVSNTTTTTSTSKNTNSTTSTKLKMQVKSN